jgi:hypothetical protein
VSISFREFSYHRDIANKITRWSWPTRSQKDRECLIRTNLSLAKKVEAKVADFDIRGAVKLLSSDDSLASFNEDVAEELKKNILHHLANFFSQTLPNQETLV